MQRPRYALAVLVLGLVGLVLGVPLALAEALGTLSGQITQRGSGAPIAGATVDVACGAMRRRAVTDGAGRFTIANLPPGSCTVQAHGAGFSAARSTIAVTSGAPAGVQLALAAVPPADAKQGKDRDKSAEAPSGRVAMDTEATSVRKVEPGPPPPPRPLPISPPRRESKRMYAPQAMAAASTSRPIAIDPQLDEGNTEAYARIDDNPFRRVADAPMSTFSADVDTGSYSNLRKFITDGALPPKDAVRVEEMLNYFKYDLPRPTGGDPFSITTEVGPAPWAPRHQLVRIGLAAPAIPDAQVPARNLVFLIDVSGSMSPANKLPLLVQSMNLLVDNLRAEDKVALVVYAGAAGVVLPPTSGARKDTIRAALAQLAAGGSTNGGAGIKLAYQVAQSAKVRGGINRVILCSDGDYNVGTTSEGELTRLIETERERGISLTVLGFGRGNLKDATMEKLADRGNGNYAYIDSLAEARKVLVKEAGATLVTVAKDVKLQIELNPALVAGYRLIGYENRALRDEDFNDDTKDAGDIGAGHHVTALYEIVPAGQPVPGRGTVDALKYQRPTTAAAAAASAELLTVKVRYKAPDGATSKLMSRPVLASPRELPATSDDFRWAASIAAFGMQLRDSTHRGQLSWPALTQLAAGSLGRDPEGYRTQALALIRAASKLPR